jgi:hypothetical protein
MAAALAAENQETYSKALDHVSNCTDAYQRWVTLLRTFDK